MSEFGVTPEGFNRKRLDLLLEELNEEVRSVFGENFNLSPESPDGQINGIVSESNALLWEVAQQSYDAWNPATSTGVSLSNLVKVNGISRLDALPSSASLDLTGDPGVVIPKGSLVSSGTGTTVFETTAEATLDGSGNATVNSQATVNGPNEAGAGTLTVIETPITGWDTVTNPSDAVLGRFEETDAELRARREQSTGRPSQSQFDSILSDVLTLQGVQNATLIENNTPNIVDGRPPHSFELFVTGGLDKDIAESIYLKGPVGIQPFGSTTVVVGTSSIGFSRPVEIDIFVIVETSVEPDYPENGDDIIKQNIIDYANGDLIEGRDFSLGKDIINSRLYTPANVVQGHSISSILIGKTSPPSSENDISIAPGEIGRFTIANISVVHV